MTRVLFFFVFFLGGGWVRGLGFKVWGLGSRGLESFRSKKQCSKADQGHRFVPALLMYENSRNPTFPTSILPTSCRAK